MPLCDRNEEDDRRFDVNNREGRVTFDNRSNPNPIGPCPCRLDREREEVSDVDDNVDLS